MKKNGRAIVILLSMLIVCATACGGEPDVIPTPVATSTPTATPTPTPEPEMMPPSVSYLPEGWQLDSEVYYGEYAAAGEPKTGSLQYTSEDNNTMVLIKYGELPSWVSGKEYDAQEFLEALLSQGCDTCEKPDPDETGTITFCDRLAAYAKFSMPEQNAFGIIVLYANASMMIELDAVWWAADKENEVMSIIGNVSY